MSVQETKDASTEYFLVGKSSVYDLGKHKSHEDAKKSDYCNAMGGNHPDSLVVCRAEAHEIMRQLRLKLSHYDNSAFKQ